MLRRARSTGTPAMAWTAALGGSSPTAVVVVGGMVVGGMVVGGMVVGGMVVVGSAVENIVVAVVVIIVLFMKVVVSVIAVVVLAPLWMTKLLRMRPSSGRTFSDVHRLLGKSGFTSKLNGSQAQPGSHTLLLRAASLGNQGQKLYKGVPCLSLTAARSSSTVPKAGPV